MATTRKTAKKSKPRKSAAASKTKRKVSSSKRGKTPAKSKRAARTARALEFAGQRSGRVAEGHASDFLLRWRRCEIGLEAELSTWWFRLPTR